MDRANTGTDTKFSSTSLSAVWLSGNPVGGSPPPEVLSPRNSAVTGDGEKCDVLYVRHASPRAPFEERQETRPGVFVAPHDDVGDAAGAVAGRAHVGVREQGDVVERRGGPSVHDRGVGVGQVLGVCGADHLKALASTVICGFSPARAGKDRPVKPRARPRASGSSGLTCVPGRRSRRRRRRGAPEQDELLGVPHLVGRQVGQGGVDHGRTRLARSPRGGGRFQGQAQEALALDRDRRRVVWRVVDRGSSELPVGWLPCSGCAGCAW